ncbi:NAD(P)/FAD-dependent oxidoreductase [Sphaerochaeta sp. PS]|uniref:NAD(P)/FAD-dependent oxidoreductase n=1 Tax=Sphaerochaeta sp. PS TaxID=3076336 RepID=UPI0028A4055C|nr:NAD(P)/FAD-dependent oxidoreductase [Sphaerochaeta sp. PS]MDT4763419.1 NAD(P)/FAD-dependent oxidoreductase [Sphaerochaeta sp. PS]
MYDVIIIGGGAAGLFLAANLPGKHVLLLEGSPQVGKKILITGGGMCNLTNNKKTDSFLTHFGSPVQGNFLKPSLLNFNTDDSRHWFEDAGLPLVEREDGKVFPSCMRAGAVVDLLVAIAKKNGVRIQPSAKVRAVEKLGELYSVSTDTEQFQTTAVVLTTGGMSYPTTGSDGSGYLLAKSLGHLIVSPTPALVAVSVLDYPFTPLAGNAIRDASVECFHAGEGKRYHLAQGDMLFTHDGLSGPVILHSSRQIRKGDLLKASLLPSSNKEELRKRLGTLFSENPKKQLYTILKAEGLTAHLAEQLLTLASLTVQSTSANLTKNQMQKLIDLLVAFPFTVSGKKGFNAAMVTSGGVDLSEVDRKTMESKRNSNLYLCGEILDIDGDSGGYNLQAAFSTAKLASVAIMAEKKE